MAERRADGLGSKPIQRPGRKGWYSKVRVTDPATGESRRVWVSGPTQRDLAANIRKLLNETQVGRMPVADKRLTVEAYAKTWMNDHLPARDVTPSTRRLYTHALESYVIPNLGSVSMKMLRATHVERLDVILREQGRSQSTRRLAYNVLNMVFATAVRDKVVTINPVPGVTRPTETPTAQAYYSPTKLERLLARVKGERILEHLVPLLAWTALRTGEAMALRWEHVDLDRRVLWVRATTAVDEHGRVYRQPFTKSKRPRPVPLVPQAVKALKAQRKAQAAERLAAGEAWVDNDLVFSDQLGGLLDDRNLRRRYAPLVKAAGLTGSFHALRRSTATWLTAAKVPLNVISAILGHSSTAVTQQRYAVVDVEIMTRAMADLEAYLGEPRKAGVR